MERGKIVYLSGKIVGNDNYKAEFKCAELFLKQMGYIVINSSEVHEAVEGLTCEQYMQIYYKLMDISDIVFMVSGWQDSKSANAELVYAKSLGKKVMYQDYYAPFRKGSDDEARNSN